MSDLRQLYQELILDHGRHPRHFGPLEDAMYHQEGFNPLCGDKITLHLSEHHQQINKIKFEGSGCAISIASASLMCEFVSGKARAEIETIFKSFHQLLTERDQAGLAQLGKLSVLAGVAEFPARVKCATLAWHTLMSLLRNEVGVVCTEEER